MDMKQPKVATIAGDNEIDHAIATLVLAFGTDPVARWMYDDPHEYLLHIPRLFRALGTCSFEAEAAQRTNDGLGIAIWLPPGVHGDDGPLEAVIAGSMSGKSKPKSPPSSSRRIIIGQLSPIGTCRSSALKLYIRTKNVERHYCSMAFVDATRSTSQPTFGHRTR